MKKNILKKLYEFFSGQKNNEGEQLFNHWFDSFDDSRGYLDQISTPKKKEHKKQLFESIQQQIAFEANDSAEKKSPSSVVFTTTKTLTYRIAAVLIVGVMLSMTSYFLYEDITIKIKGSAIVKKATAIGEIKKVVLPDGSKVWLSTKSTLQYSQNFSSGSRSVKLEGEAFFDVKRDTTRPFLVDAGVLKTRVLGTSFNIRAYPDDQNMAVTLASGKVKVSDTNHPEDAIMLHPDQQVFYVPQTGFSEIRDTDASTESAWMDGELVFKRESFAHIGRTFERWYGVEFIFKDPSLKEELFVYHFKELSLAHSMNVLSKLADFEYTITKNQVIIR